MSFSDLFLWFYCLPAYKSLTLTVLAACLLCRIFRQPRTGVFTALLWGLLLAAVFLPLYQTVLSRTVGLPRPPVLQPFAFVRQLIATGNREILLSCWMNVLLFFPAGLFLALLLDRRRAMIPAALLLLACFSAGLEFCQYRFSLGIAEADDLLFNTLGAALGLAFPFCFGKIHAFLTASDQS